MFLTNAPLRRGISKWAGSGSAQMHSAMPVGPSRELPDRSNHDISGNAAVQEAHALLAPSDGCRGGRWFSPWLQAVTVYSYHRVGWRGVGLGLVEVAPGALVLLRLSCCSGRNTPAVVAHLW